MNAPHVDGLVRCPWPKQDPLYVAYHDEEWGVPEYDDCELFEKLLLDGFQAGLSWITILRKRENFRRAFDGFAGGKPKVNRFRSTAQVPAETAVSRRISRELASRGFKFCGPTIVYAFMQAVGMVNDHLVSCYRHATLAKTI
jgi:DNA-3-methyladenine glycosylase I